MVTANKNKKPIIKESSKPCARCTKDRPYLQYYQTYDLKTHPDGKMAYCKTCLKEMILDDNGQINIDKVKDTLRKVDRPFIYKYWNSALQDEKDTFGVYLKNIWLNCKTLTWADSDEYKNNINTSKDINEDNYDADITPEMIQRWGRNHEMEDYITLEQFYQDMKFANKVETPSEINYLKKLAVISLKMDRELENGNYDEAKKLGDLYSKYMADSQFRAMDKTDADKTGGIRNFSQIYAELEKDDFIPPWEYYRKIKGITQDIVDKTIMHIENFTLKLNRVEKMTSPPKDTPKLESYEIDNENKIQINDIEVDKNFDEGDVDEGDL